jgi:hypothetical protein
MEGIAVHQSSVDVAKQHFSHRSLPTRSLNSDASDGSTFEEGLAGVVREQKIGHCF